MPPGDGSRRAARCSLRGHMPFGRWVLLSISGEEAGREPSMTQDYLIGELSVRLEQLLATTACSTARDLTRLRHQVEAGSPAGLTCAARRALALADALCWESLSRGDAATFARQAQVAADLRQFGLCARLLND